MTVGTYFTRPNWITRLSFCASATNWCSLCSIELPVQLLYFRHQIRIEAANLDSGLAKTELSTPADSRIRIKNSNHDALYPTFDDSLDAGYLGVIPRRAWLQRRKESRP